MNWQRRFYAEEMSKQSFRIRYQIGSPDNQTAILVLARDEASAITNFRRDYPGCRLLEIRHWPRPGSDRRTI